MNRKSFILHIDSLAVLEDLTNDQKAELFQAMYDYNSGKEVTLNGLMKAIFVPFRTQFDRDNNKYLSVIERNRQNGEKGGRPKKTDNNQENPVGLSETQGNPKNLDNDNKNDSDNDNDNKKRKKSLASSAAAVAACDPALLEKFKKLQDWIALNAPQVAKMAEPLTADQLGKLYKLYTNRQVADMLLKMHNRATLLKNNRSAYLTIRNWLNREHPDISSPNNDSNYAATRIKELQAAQGASSTAVQ